MHRAVSLWKRVIQRSVYNTTWVAALTGLTCRRAHSISCYHVNRMKEDVLLCGIDCTEQCSLQPPSPCHVMKRQRPSFIASQTHSQVADLKNWISQQNVLRNPNLNTKDFRIPQLLYSYSKSQTPNRVSFPRAVRIPQTLGNLSSPFLPPEDSGGILECSNRAREKEGMAWCGRVVEYHLPAEVREEGVVQCSSVMKKRRRKMNRHKYKKWRKKMRFLRRSLGKWCLGHCCFCVCISIVMSYIYSPGFPIFLSLIPRLFSDLRSKPKGCPRS